MKKKRKWDFRSWLRSLRWIFHRRVVLIPVIGGCQLRIEERENVKTLLIDDSSFLSVARELHYITPRDFTLDIDDVSVVIPRWAFPQVRELITGKALQLAK